MSTDGTAAAVFEAIGHPDRLSILEVLIEARRSGGASSVRFTDLRDRSAIDDTGRFNYHLDQLVGTMVTKTDDGYRLSSYAHRILAPMMGGIYDPERATQSLDADGDCDLCGAPLRIEPDENILELVCEQGHVNNQGLLGYPGVVGDRSESAANDALGLINLQGSELATSGICPTCHGPVDGAIRQVQADDIDDIAGDEGSDFLDSEPIFVFEAPCETCGNQFATSVGGCVATHPAVVSFLFDHGIDVRNTAPWTLSFVSPGAETVASTDPLQLAVEIVRGDASVTLTVDRSGTVAATDRTPR